MMSKWIVVFLITGCNQNFSTGINSSDSGNPDNIFHNTNISDGRIDSDTTIPIRKPTHSKTDSSTPVLEKDADASVPTEAKIYEANTDSVQKEQKDSGSKDANVVNSHDDYMGVADSSNNSDSGRPDCDDKTLAGCTGVYGQPCRTYRLPPYKCVCLLSSEDCVLK